MITRVQTAAAAPLTLRVAADDLRSVVLDIEDAAAELAVAQDGTRPIGTRMAARNRGLARLAVAVARARETLPLVNQVRRCRGQLVMRKGKEAEQP